MLIILLHVFLVIGFIVGWIQGSQELKSSKLRFGNTSTLKYFFG